MPSSLLQPGRLALAALVLCAGLSACAGNPAAIADTRYDLGPPGAPPAAGTLPPVKVLDVSAPPALDNDSFAYRLSYADPQRIAHYAGSHWTMSPARLLTQRLRAALASKATVLSGGDAVAAPMLKVELDEFEQVFDSSTESSGVLSARATLIQNGRVLGQHTFVARAPASSPDAEGGASALAAASDQLVGQISAWLSVQAAGSP
ncbi:ABC transporter [Burkholderia sp. WAC0059]|uniref:ABC-type transport auxiliary lipoprotein family protein n=1 Tax=Burkholderia sp. WAC0059 TaxID=2066022 RepID=UPI000C7F404C|nr:ABC-type transport auxiliary lipoprotein family protein [Burkholderia sp. WAC0059]PLZ03472.1 ABC transporter [Burkholderia sp. WAC0059]